jgi:hypothetical protein
VILHRYENFLELGFQIVLKKFLKKEHFLLERIILLRLMELRDVCLHFPFLLHEQESFLICHQNYCGLTFSSFIKKYGQFLREADIKNILIQAFVSSQVYGDLSGYLRTDFHSKNYCIEVYPSGLECQHSYYFQFTETEYYEIVFNSPYYLWMIDFGTDKPSSFYYAKQTFVGINDNVLGEEKKNTRSYTNSTTKVSIESQNSGI